MKYPKKFKGKLEYVLIPTICPVKKNWIISQVLENGTTIKNSISNFDEEKHAWIPANAHNKRVGYNDKEVKKILNFARYGKKIKKSKKAKKVKKSKAIQKGNSSSISLKEGFFRSRKDRKKKRKRRKSLED